MSEMGKGNWDAFSSLYSSVECHSVGIPKGNLSERKERENLENRLSNTDAGRERLWYEERESNFGSVCNVHHVKYLSYSSTTTTTGFKLVTEVKDRMENIRNIGKKESLHVSQCCIHSIYSIFPFICRLRRWHRQNVNVLFIYSIFSSSSRCLLHVSPSFPVILHLFLSCHSLSLLLQSRVISPHLSGILHIFSLLSRCRGTVSEETNKYSVLSI